MIIIKIGITQKQSEIAGSQNPIQKINNKTNNCLRRNKLEIASHDHPPSFEHPTSFHAKWNDVFYSL
jgi:hypothetical protein